MKHLNVSYSKAGDQLKIYWDDEPSWADELDNGQHITVLRSLADDKLVVGCKIWGLSEILAKAGLKLVANETN